MKRLTILSCIFLILGNANGAGVTARAGTTQKVVNTGTMVAAAQNSVVDTECQTKFNSCIDAFCMADNIDGGRCQCSAQFTKLAQQHTTIKRQEYQSYQLATTGVDILENNTNVPTAPKTTTRGTRSRVDLSQWNTQNTDTDTETSGETGAELFKKAINICIERIPECKSNQDFLTTIYNQKIKSDCSAYENAIKQQRTATQNRTAEAQRAMRTTAYKKLQEANKYDLGQCTLEYKKCMMTTAECGDDFKGCVGIAAADKARVKPRQQSNATTYEITGGTTSISIAYSSYDILESKKPICDSILNQCQNVRDQVWNAFLREAAPQIKTAELMAESDMRTSCMSNISNCFQKACKDNIDPKDPDGSYDMCLSRPETVKSLCQVQIDPCEKSEPLILDYVYARLAAMRVDSCTTEVKQCLQSEDRCGKDYTACVGLDTDTIIRMCPYDKLTGCQKVYQDTDIRGDAVYDELANMVQGIMLGIDNNLLEFCQNAANEAMIRACGTTENCNNMTADKYLGARSLNYGICYYTYKDNDISIDYSKCFSNASQIRDVDLGRVEGSLTGQLGPVVPLMAVLDGVMFWELVTINDDGNLTSADEYFTLSGSTQMPQPTQELIRSELSQLKSSIDATIQAIEIDPTVQYCMTGRKVRGMKDASRFGTQVPRFPQLTRQMRKQIATSALKNAKANYYKKYDELSERQLKDYIEIAERQAEIKGENAKDVRREAARQSCVSLADMAALPMSPPPRGWGMWLVAGIVTVVGAIVTVVSFGSAGAPVGAGLAALWSSIVGGGASVGALSTGLVTITAISGSVASGFSIATGLTAAGVAAAVGVATAAVGTAMVIGSTIAETAANHDKGNTKSMQLQMEGHHELNQWNFKQVIDTTFDWRTLKCTKCITETQCLETSHPLFGAAKCKKWAEPNPTECTDTQF